MKTRITIPLAFVLFIGACSSMTVPTEPGKFTLTESQKQLAVSCAQEGGLISLEIASNGSHVVRCTFRSS